MLNAIMDPFQGLYVCLFLVIVAPKTAMELTFVPAAAEGIGSCLGTLCRNLSPGQHAAS